LKLNFRHFPSSKLRKGASDGEKHRISATGIASRTEEIF
jgi:hypothetical protein